MPKERTLDEEALEQRRAYHRAWRRAHRDKVRQYNQDYWNGKAYKARRAAARAKKEQKNSNDAEE